MTTEEAKTKKDHNGILDGDGSPITVGGGGGLEDEHKNKFEGTICCRFSDTDYPDPAPGGHGTKHFRHKNGSNVKIKTFKITTVDGTVDHSNLLPPNGNCNILIQCEGAHDDVNINGGHFGIDMNTDTYPNSGGGYHCNPNVDSFINRVTLVGTGQILGDWFFNRDDACQVCTDHVKPDKSDCPT